ncbi:type III secretion system chaperone [Burkholderia savannae]|uniref:type III secretion system chaperone n=1 Tax=Burkholderia savannae TaxID=1637837 RepID=UPI001CF7B47E|nr:type III secretion system chaperone [Burkholderia savannae]
MPASAHCARTSRISVAHGRKQHASSLMRNRLSREPAMRPRPPGRTEATRSRCPEAVRAAGPRTFRVKIETSARYSKEVRARLPNIGAVRATKSQSMEMTNALLGEFGARIGLSDLKFDATGVCQLRIDDLKLALYDNRALDCLTLLAELPMPTVDTLQREAWTRFVLARQFDALHEHVPTIGLNPQTDALVAMRHLSPANLTLERLTGAFAGLVEWLAAWSRESCAIEQQAFSASHDALRSTREYDALAHA